MELLAKMITSGMRIVRLNLSHDSLEFHAETIKMIREVVETMAKERGYMVDVAIAIDTKGPEIRTGLLEAGPNAEIELKTNDNLRLSTNPDLFDKGNREVIYVDYPNIIYVLQVGQVVYINDGAVKLLVKEVGVDCISCVVERGGICGSRKKVNIPGATIDLPAVSERDRNDLKFGIEQQVDIVFATAMRNAEAVHEVRKILKDKGKNIKLIAKIDCLQGLENFDEILEAADGILFVRSDLAIEIPSAKVFLAQKAIAARCNRAGKPCIISTDLLESLRTNVRPTRAEIADLGNVVLDGADAVLLASETSIGHYPELAIRTMGNIMREAQSAIWYRSFFNDLISQNLSSIDAAHSVAIAAVDASIKTMATAIIVLTTSGRSAQLVAKYKPHCPILAVTRCPRSGRQLHICRGIIPLLYTEPPPKHWLESKDIRIQYALNVAKRMNLVKTGDPVVVVSPWREGTGFTNTMHLIYAFYEPEDFTEIIDPEAKSRKSSVNI